MEVAEHRPQFHHRFAIELHVHPKHPVRARMMRPHRDFQQTGLKTLLLQQLVIGRGSGQTMTFPRWCFSNISVCAVGSHS